MEIEKADFYLPALKITLKRRRRDSRSSSPLPSTCWLFKISISLKSRSAPRMSEAASRTMASLTESGRRDDSWIGVGVSVWLACSEDDKVEVGVANGGLGSGPDAVGIVRRGRYCSSIYDIARRWFQLKKVPHHNYIRQLCACKSPFAFPRLLLYQKRDTYTLQEAVLHHHSIHQAGADIVRRCVSGELSPGWYEPTLMLEKESRGREEVKMGRRIVGFQEFEFLIQVGEEKMS